MTDELTPEEKALHEHLLEVLFNEQDCPTPVHFAARAEICNLRARLAKYEGKPAKAEKGSTAKADKTE